MSNHVARGLLAVRPIVNPMVSSVLAVTISKKRPATQVMKQLCRYIREDVGKLLETQVWQDHKALQGLPADDFDSCIALHRNEIQVLSGLGHVALWLASGGESAVFTGDMIHHPVQLKIPGWNCFGCMDQAQSASTRQRVLAECVDRDATLLPAHFLSPFGGRLKRSGEGYWWADKE